MKQKLKIFALRISALLLLLVLCLPAYKNALADDTATVNIPVYKVVSGGTPSSAETFVFKLTAVDGAPMPSGSVSGVKTVTIAGGGNTNFGTITYTDVGDYAYTIYEAAGSDTMYTYDTTIYELTVQVTWKNETGGALEAAMYIHKQGETAKCAQVLFTNLYDGMSVVVDPPVQKVISGDTPSTSSTFIFYLKADDTSYPMPSGSSGGLKVITLTDAGTKDFGDITFTEAGTYTYTVYERKGSASGYTYDTTVYYMTITVTEVNGELTATRTIKNASGTVQSALIFTNDYEETDDPKTGDTSIRYVWWILLGIGVIGICATLCYWRKQNH